VIACFSSHLSQGYHDLRILVGKRFKISKGVKVNCLWNSSFGSSEEIFGGSEPRKLWKNHRNFQSLQSHHSVSTEEQLKGIQHLSGNIILPRVKPSIRLHHVVNLSDSLLLRLSLSLSPPTATASHSLLHHCATAAAFPHRRWPCSLCVTRARPGTPRRRWAAVEEEGGRTARGVDLDPLGSSKEKKKEALIYVFNPLSRRSLRSRRRTTLHRWIYSGELLLFNVTRSLIWRGPLVYVPWHKRISRSSTSFIFFPFKVNRDQTLIPRSIWS
jgi:hypothetical protein